MKHWHMLTVVGRDRPGIVAALTDALYRGGANLGEASMTRLGGNFTIMLMVESGTDTAGLAELLDPIAQKFEFRLHLDKIDGRLHAHVEPNVRVAVHGADRPGIVAQVTTALATQGFNILDLDSDVGGDADKPIYIMVLEGYAHGGAEALERAAAPLRAGGIQVRITPIDVLLG